MARSTPIKRFILAVLLLSAAACSAPAAGLADRPAGVIDKDHYEHSLSYPPG